MTPEDLRLLYHGARNEIFRLEAQPHYQVMGETERLAAFAAGHPLPMRPAKARWLEEVGIFRARGVHVHRVHVIDLPVGPYLRYEIEGAYPENIAAGEGVRLADRASNPGLADVRRDFVLIDSAIVVWFDYDQDGRLAGYEPAFDHATVLACTRTRDLAMAASLSLDTFAERVA
jgi:hypothetical protein